MESSNENFSGDCRSCLSTFDLISPSDFASFKFGHQQYSTELRSDFGSASPSFSPSSGFSQMRRYQYDANTFMPPSHFMRPDMFMQPNVFSPFNRPMQPNMLQSNLYKHYDGYWKNYWQEYYRRSDCFAPSERWQDEERQGEPFEQDDFKEQEYHPTPQRHRPRNRPAERQRSDFENEGEEHNERPKRSQSDRTNTIIQAAKDSVGQQLFRFIPGTPGRLGCAASVSSALNKAGFEYARHAGVHGLTQQLQRNGWTKHDGIQNAQPGDVVVIVRRTGWENGGGGSHIGIVGENRKVYHNSSGRQQWVEDSLQKVFGGGIMRFILRPPRT